MILSAHQPAYLPWLGYFHKIAISDVFVILDEVQFEKNSFTNRNKIKTSNGTTWISVPMKMNGHIQKTINQMEIDNKFNWRAKHWKSLYLNYKKSPYFNLYSDFLEETYKKEWSNICDLTDHINRYLLNELGIKTKLCRQSDVNIKNKKQELILELCKKFESEIFVFGKMGENYVNVDYFKDNKVNPYFQEYKHPTYIQHWGEFVPNLTIMDLLFNVNKDNVLEIIMNGNITKEKISKMFL
ncbi:WbqC family protein [Clostridium sp. ZBS13]|uniref:WbqC family protein n=1 Tax=Clostridium sp. ZBS13 TaxID=2949971 RepID=UPI0020796047|nr:WbqC family protein [Clostridium sp. ZBS13]